MKIVMQDRANGRMPWKRQSVGVLNPFTPKSDQCPISPAASPETSHAEVKNSDEIWLCHQFLLPHLYISLSLVGIMYLLNLGVKGSICSDGARIVVSADTGRATLNPHSEQAQASMLDWRQSILPCLLTWKKKKGWELEHGKLTGKSTAHDKSPICALG